MYSVILILDWAAVISWRIGATFYPYMDYITLFVPSE